MNNIVIDGIVGRPSKDQYFLKMARLTSTRGTCARRKVGCVLINVHGHVQATGYNGTPAGFPHCIDDPCPGHDLPSGTGLDECEAIHAEQNALLQCHDVQSIYTAYCTASPCVTCTKLLLNTSCQRIVFLEAYPDSEKSRRLWERAGREWLQM